MSNTRILIVEDEGIVAAELASKLGQLGYEIAGIVERGEEAVAMACRLHPDLVLMDIWLKGPMDGIEAAEAVRREHDLPIVYLTAHSDPATLARAKLTGPFGYVLKPFDERDLATQIEMALYRHQADRQLCRQREWLRVTLRSIGDAVIAADVAARITFVNPVAESITGWKAEEAAGQPIQCVFRVVNEQTGLPLEEPAARVLREGRTVELANHAALVTKDGRTVPIEDSAAPILDAAGQVIGVVLVFHDVSEKRRADEALAKQREEQQVILDSTPAFIFYKDRENRFLRVNRAFADSMGTPKEQLDGMSLFDLYPRQQAEDFWKDDQEVMAAGRPKMGILEPMQTPAGERWVQTDKVPCRDAQGNVIGVIGFSVDITERKRAEEALQESECRLRTLGDQIPGGAIYQHVLRPDGRVEYAYMSAGVARLFGLSAERVMADPDAFRQLIVEEDRERVSAAEEQSAHELTPFDCEFRQRGVAGEVKWVQCRSMPRRLEDGSILWDGIVVDITERRQAEESLREANDKLRTLFDTSADAIGVGKDGIQVFANPAFIALFGCSSAEEIVGRPITDYIAPSQRQAILENTQRRSRRESAPGRYETRGLRKDGTEFDMDVRASTYQTADGTYVVVILRDITERKRAEAELAAAKVRAEQAKAAAEAANEAKSQFLANMSHELRTPMNAILGMIDVALPKAIDPIVQDCLQTAKGSADLLLTLLNDLLDSAKIESGKLELESAPFSLRRMLDQITRVLAVRASEKGLSFYCRMPDDTPAAIVGDRTRLQQVLLNLASNAIKFTERGDVEISLRPQSHDGEACLEFAVRDTGIGIPPSGMERLFQPFGQADASMSRRFGGTGLGLSICKNLVEMMGGRIWAESEVGKGSTFHFTVRLPLAKELPRDFEAPVALPTAACGQLRVLLVEDNPANQKLATYILQDRGHVVEIAGDGQEAIYLTDQNRYDVILMDVQMPGMNGLEATAAIRKRENSGSRVPIIAMTAHAMKGDRDRCLAAGMDGYLSKPVNAQEIIGLVESLAQGVVPPAAMPGPAETSFQTTALVFNPDEALTRCFNSANMVREMIQCFYDEVDNLFPQMREALAKGDLVEVGRLGHRMKGTVVYLGAQPAKEAALRVERFCKSSGGTESEAGEAINVLEHECIALKAALGGHPLAAEPA